MLFISPSHPHIQKFFCESFKSWLLRTKLPELGSGGRGLGDSVNVRKKTKLFSWCLLIICTASPSLLIWLYSQLPASLRQTFDHFGIQSFVVLTFWKYGMTYFGLLGFRIIFFFSVFFVLLFWNTTDQLHFQQAEHNDFTQYMFLHIVLVTCKVLFSKFIYLNLINSKILIGKNSHFDKFTIVLI